MKQTLRTMSLIAVLSGSTVASQAQVVWSQNFNSEPLGAYGAYNTDFQNDPTTPALPANNIVTPGQGGSGNAMAFTFNTLSGTTVNIQTRTLTYAASGNTSANLADYTLSFDLAIEGVNLAAGFGGLEISLLENTDGIFGKGVRKDFLAPADAPPAGSGYLHFSYNLGTLVATSGGILNPTAASFGFGVGVVAFGNGMTASPERLLFDNVQVTMVPEPSTCGMFVAGIGLLVGSRRYRRVS